jgi:hypothetical protein
MPEGVTEDQAAINLTQTSLTMILTDGMTLNVSVRGWYPSDQYNMSVRGAFPGVKTDKKARAVNGHPTYWSVALRGGKWTRDGIEWEYAPGAWAHLYGGMWIGYPNIQAQDLKMAASRRRTVSACRTAGSWQGPLLVGAVAAGPDLDLGARAAESGVVQAFA